MARKKGFIQRGVNILEAIEAGFIAPISIGLARSAEGIVRDLQKEGPAWSGEFSNSWEIASSGAVNSGTGATGAPQPLKAPILTPNQIKFKPEVKYYIANKAPHADYALDLKEGRFWPNGEPKAPRDIVISGSRPKGPHKRGAVTPGEGKATSSAAQDWYVRYLQEKRIDRAISTYMDQAMRNVKL